MPDPEEPDVQRFNLEVIERAFKLCDIPSLAEIKNYLVERVQDFEDDWLTGLWPERLLDLAAACLALWLAQDTNIDDKIAMWS